MMKKKVTFFILILILLFNCCIGSINQYGRDEEKLLEELKRGNLKSYHELKILYLDYKAEDFLSIAKFASDSLNYKDANLDVFECYFNKYNFDYDNLDKINLNQMQKKDEHEAIYYLKKALKDSIKGAEHYKILIIKSDNLIKQTSTKTRMLLDGH